MSNTRALEPAAKPLWVPLCSTPLKRHLDSSSVVLFSGPLRGDKRKQASDHRKVTLHHVVRPPPDTETKRRRRRRRRRQWCRGGWKKREVSERELKHPRGSPSWTPELSQGSDPGGTAVQQSGFVNQKAKGRMEGTPAVSIVLFLAATVVTRRGSDAIISRLKVKKNL